MSGEIDGNTLVGKLTEDRIDGIISNESSLVGDINPLTTKVIRNYNQLQNKPQINEVELINNKNLEDLNVNRLTNADIENIINSIII